MRKFRLSRPCLYLPSFYVVMEVPPLDLLCCVCASVTFLFVFLSVYVHVYSDILGIGLPAWENCNLDSALSFWFSNCVNLVRLKNRWKMLLHGDVVG